MSLLSQIDSAVASGAFQLLALAVTIFLVCKVYLYRRDQQVSLPPGPPGNILSGNAFQIPKERPWIQFHKWSQKYGPEIIAARVFSRRLIIINSYELAYKLLEKRPEKYWNRPKRIMAELSGFDETLLLKPYNKDVKDGRRMIYNMDLKAYFALQTQYAYKFSRLILDRPSELHKHIRNITTASLLEFTYGYQVNGGDDPLVELVEELMNITGKLTSSTRYLVDIFPLLNLLPEGLPGTGFKTEARHNKEVLDSTANIPFAEVVDKMKRGQVDPCFVSSHLRDKLDTMDDTDLYLLKQTANIITAAGSDTTASLLSTFFLNMVLNPNVLKKAQQEITDVLGPNTLPTFADRSRLPYIGGILKECLRWGPPTPLSSARSLTADDEINGYIVPAGAFIIVNAWGIGRNPEHYPDPEKFMPERYLVADDTNSKATMPPDPQAYVFGLGRRRCPGNELAMNVAYIIVATVVALFDIHPEVDEEGKPVLPEAKYTSGLNSHPLPFSCKIIPRSADAHGIIADAF